MRASWERIITTVAHFFLFFPSSLTAKPTSLQNHSFTSLQISQSFKMHTPTSNFQTYALSFIFTKKVTLFHQNLRWSWSRKWAKKYKCAFPAFTVLQAFHQTPCVRDQNPYFQANFNAYIHHIHCIRVPLKWDFSIFICISDWCWCVLILLLLRLCSSEWR